MGVGAGRGRRVSRSSPRAQPQLTAQRSTAQRSTAQRAPSGGQAPAHAARQPSPAHRTAAATAPAAAPAGQRSRNNQAQPPAPSPQPSRVAVVGHVDAARRQHLVCLVGVAIEVVCGRPIRWECEWEGGRAAEGGAACGVPSAACPWPRPFRHSRRGTAGASPKSHFVKVQATPFLQEGRTGGGERGRRARRA